MEYIIIRGVPVLVPPEVVSEGREAVGAWHAAQLAAPATAPAVPSLATES